MTNLSKYFGNSVEALDNFPAQFIHGITVQISDNKKIIACETWQAENLPANNLHDAVRFAYDFTANDYNVVTEDADGYMVNHDAVVSVNIFGLRFVFISNESNNYTFELIEN
jgi:hypothetical protein